MNWKILGLGFGVTIVGIGVGLGVTNPPPEDYVDFATVRATEYIETEACTKELPLVGNSFQDECIQAVKSEPIQDRLRATIVANTERQNYLILSFYRTEVAIQDLVPLIPADFLPTYQVQTIGALNQFRIYEAQES
jgi:hypothetical protein